MWFDAFRQIYEQSVIWMRRRWPFIGSTFVTLWTKYSFSLTICQVFHLSVFAVRAKIAPCARTTPAHVRTPRPLVHLLIAPSINSNVRWPKIIYGLLLYVSWTVRFLAQHGGCCRDLYQSKGMYWNYLDFLPQIVTVRQYVVCDTQWLELDGRFDWDSPVYVVCCLGHCNDNMR